MQPSIMQLTSTVMVRLCYSSNTPGHACAQHGRGTMGELPMPASTISTRSDRTLFDRTILSRGSALTYAARSWFLTTVCGQMAFAAYIAALYIKAAMAGDWASWNKIMPNGLIAGDGAGNAALVAHLDPVEQRSAGIAFVELDAGVCRPAAVPPAAFLFEPIFDDSQRIGADLRIA